MSQIADQVRERLAKLSRIDLHRERLGGRRDVELKVLAEAAVSEVDGLDELRHSLVRVHRREV